VTDKELLSLAKEIVAQGCSCDRHCDELVGPDVFCGCEKDAQTIINLVRNNSSK